MDENSVRFMLDTMAVDKLDLALKLQFKEWIKRAIEHDERTFPEETHQSMYLNTLDKFLEWWEAISKKKELYYKAMDELRAEYSGRVF